MSGFRSWLFSRQQGRVTPEGDNKDPWQERPSIFWVKEFGAAAVPLDGDGLDSSRPSSRPSRPSRPSWPTPARLAPAASTRRRVLAIARDFMDNSYISGVTLMGRRSIPLWDRLFWACVVMAAVVASIREVPKTYWDLYEHPSTVEVLSTSLELHAFPFPSVYVCPKMKIRKSLALEYLRRMNRNNGLSPNDTQILLALRTLQHYRLPFWLNRQPPDLPRRVLDLFQGVDLRHFMSHVAPDCESVFQMCLWAGTEVDCCSVFRRTNSNAGLCYAFNSFTTPEAKKNCSLIPLEQRPLELGSGIWYFHRPNKTECELVRSGSAAAGSGLEFFLRRSNLSDSVSPPGRGGGYDISVQAANQDADMERGVFLDETEETITQAKVTYSETAVDPWMASLPYAQRGCLFEDERPRELFDHISTGWYTQDTCLFACRLAFLVERCGCYPYLIFKQERQCSLEEYRCLIKHNSRLYWVRVPADVGETSEERNHTLWPDCRACLPMCSLSIYDVDYETTPTLYGNSSRRVAFVNVFYRDLHSAIKYTERRDKEPTEAMMSYAAASNLLLGVSVMSMVQLVMYLGEVALALSVPTLHRLLGWRRRWWRPVTPRTTPLPPPVQPAKPPLPFVL